MGNALVITTRFLQPFSHGRAEDGRPEWPPSPLRLFQALVSSSLGRTQHSSLRAEFVDALRWLEQQAAPVILAPPADVMNGYRLFVPDNVGDKVARAWSAGRHADIAEFRTEKDVVAVRLHGEAVHYVFSAGDEIGRYFPAVRAMARRLTHLGWGIDQVAGDATQDVEGLGGERWIPGRHGRGSLRWASPGTLAALEEKHAQFERRLEGGRFRPVSPLTAFQVCLYARTVDEEPRPATAFRLLDPKSGRLLWLEPRRHARNVAAWLRHAVGQVSAGWPFGSTDTIVHGHAAAESDPRQPRARFSYLPLPSITPRGVGSIARVLVTASPGLDAQLDWVRRRLAGLEVSWRGTPQAVLEPLSILDTSIAGDAVVRHYIGVSTTWATVTPVVLPGHHDGSSAKAERLLLKAFVQAGWDREVLDSIVELEWRDVAFLAGVDRARSFDLPDKVLGPRYHVRVRFASAVAGPIAVGSGRHRGLGIFAAER